MIPLPLLSFPPILVAIGVIVGGVTTGFLYFRGIIGKEKAGDIRAGKDAAEFVITNLEKKISILQEGIDEQAKQINNMKNRIDQLDADNQRLLAVLQGRDSDTQRFQEEGFKVMQQSAVAIGTLTSIEQRVNRILDIVEHREVMVTKLHQDIQDTLDSANTK